MTRRKAQPKGGRTTPVDPLTRARREARAAAREALKHPGDHERRTRAFALAATVRFLEGVDAAGDAARRLGQPRP